MSNFNITVEGGSSVRLPTAGKYCDRDILITATGGGGTTPANPIIEPLSVTENGTYTAPNGVDGFSPVNVNVPIPDGYIKPSGTLNIAKNGTYDVTEKASAVVSIPEKEIVLQNKTIESNGTYSADEGYDGLGQVTVNVSGGGSENFDNLLKGTVTEINSNVTKINQYGCYACGSLKTVNIPECTSLGTRCFQANYALVSFNAPKLTTLGTYSFYGCSKLANCTFPVAASVPSNCFYSCSGLQKVDLPIAASIAAYGFYGCSKLEALILRKSDAICTLSNVNAISSSGIGKGTGYVYVPSALIDTYKTATNWSTFASQFRAIEDYPEICGG